MLRWIYRAPDLSTTRSKVYFAFANLALIVIANTINTAVHESGHAFMSVLQGGTLGQIVITPLGGYAHSENVPRGVPNMWVSAGGVLAATAFGILIAGLFVRGQRRASAARPSPFWAQLGLFWLFTLCLVSSARYFFAGSLLSPLKPGSVDPINVILHANDAGIPLSRMSVAIPSGIWWLAVVGVSIFMGRWLWNVFDLRIPYRHFLTVWVVLWAMTVPVFVQQYRTGLVGVTFWNAQWDRLLYGQLDSINISPKVLALRQGEHGIVTVSAQATKPARIAFRYTGLKNLPEIDIREGRVQTSDHLRTAEFEIAASDRMTPGTYRVAFVASIKPAGGVGTLLLIDVQPR